MHLFQFLQYTKVYQEEVALVSVFPIYHIKLGRLTLYLIVYQLEDPEYYAIYSVRGQRGFPFDTTNHPCNYLPSSSHGCQWSHWVEGGHTLTWHHQVSIRRLSYFPYEPRHT